MEKSVYNEVYARSITSQDWFTGFRNKIRARKVLKVLKPDSNDRILEIGCNTGHLIKELIVHSHNVIGIDINHAALKIANIPNLFCMDIADMGFSDNSFDKIVCIHTIEHVHKIERAFEEMARVLKPGGSILLTYPFEIIRGMGSMRDTLRTCSSKWHALVTCSFISKARQLHIYKLSPRKISKIIEGSILMLTGSSMILDPWPSYLTILKKKE